MWSLYITSFASLKLFPVLIDVIQLYGCLSIFAVSCIFGAFFVIFVLKETNGMTIEGIGSHNNNSDTDKTQK